MRLAPAGGPRELRLEKDHRDVSKAVRDSDKVGRNSEAYCAGSTLHRRNTLFAALRAIGPYTWRSVAALQLAGPR